MKKNQLLLGHTVRSLNNHILQVVLMDSMVILSANHVTVIYLEQFLKSVIMTQEPVGANQIIWDRNVSYLKVRFQSYVNNI